VPGPASRPADGEHVQVAWRASARQVASGFVVGVAFLVAAVLTDRQDWVTALVASVATGLGAGIVVLLGASPTQRGMERVERVLPVQAVGQDDGRGGWLWPTLVYGAIAAWIALSREVQAYAGAVILVGSALYAVEARQIHRWERRRGGRLGTVSSPSRRRRPFRTPEHVLLVDDPARADATPDAAPAPAPAQALSSSSVGRSGAPSK
jgi:MFS family permease